MRTSQPSQPTGTNNTGPRGLGTGLAASAGQRLPVPPRERKPALAALAVLLILGGALVSAYLVIQSGDRVSAIAVNAPVAAGERIPATALKEVSIGDTGIEYVRWSELDKVTQTYAKVPLTPGALLVSEMTSQVPDTTKGRVIVGLSLKAGQVPSQGLEMGQTLALYAVGGRESGVKPGTLLAADAVVREVPGSSSDDSELSARMKSSTEVRVSVEVLPEQAPAVTQAASAGDVAVAIVPPGTAVPQTPAPAKPQTKPTTKPGG
ncbi:hypothetical protein [Actinocorallia populi]|uniref:hypothetical protein n=1 Tax=Actinocorallia populi TaxID=2079200 RepID=UPI000D092086|nr:hypothetical protein [Actinocorallia populi]